MPVTRSVSSQMPMPIEHGLEAKGAGKVGLVCVGERMEFSEGEDSICRREGRTLGVAGTRVPFEVYGR